MHHVAIKTKIQEEGEMSNIDEAKENAKRVLCAGHFYATNAGFPKELHYSNHKYTSLLRSSCTSHPSMPLSSERERAQELLQVSTNTMNTTIRYTKSDGRECVRKLLRVSTNTTIRFTKADGSTKRGKKKFNRRRPCYLAKYDNVTNQGVIFLGTSTKPNYANQFAIVHSDDPKIYSLPFGSLGIDPPWSLKEKKTYLNISHPLLVQFAYLPINQFPSSKNEGILYDGHDPPLVAINKLIIETPDDGRKLDPFVLQEDSRDLFWIKHENYHIGDKFGQVKSKDDSGGAGPDDSGPSTGGAGPSTQGARTSTGGAGPSTQGAGTSTGGAGPSTRGARTSTRGAGHNTSGVGSSRGGFSSYQVKDAPWGQVGDQRIGIDIPLVIEDMYSDSDEEMDLEEEMDSEEFVINYDANDAPWGQVRDQCIGIEIPLVIEDIYSDSDEEMDLESLEEFQEVDDVANVGKPKSSNQEGITTHVEGVVNVFMLESSNQEGITIRSNPSDMESSWSYTIHKPYFVISICHEGIPFWTYFPKDVVALLDSDNMDRRWRWTQNVLREDDDVLLSEGLSYEYPTFFNFGTSEPERRIFNWHTKKCVGLPPHPYEHFNFSNFIVGMIVDTSMQSYAFKVIEGNDKGTIIYNSRTNLWTPRPSVPPKPNKHRLIGNASVAFCKGIVFIIDNNNEIVLYNMEKDKWDHVQGPREHIHEKLCSIGSWDDHVFSSTYCMPQYSKTFEIWELVGIDNLGWKKFDAMSRELYSWLIDGLKDHHRFMIVMSYCSENLLICASVKRFVLCNLARKTWDKLEPPPLP